MERLRVGVIFGGRSVEHDVSIVTAHQVMAALGPAHEVIPIYIDRNGAWWSGSGLNDLDAYRNKTWNSAAEPVTLAPTRGVGGLMSIKKLRSKKVDIDVIIPSVHGTFGEDGTLQGVLEMADIPYTGSGVTASAVGMDKVAMKAAFRASGLPCVPDGLVEVGRLDRDPDAVLDSVEREIGYPCFVKPVTAGSSVGIAKANDRVGLAAALDVARRYDRRVLVEKSMDGCLEINCSVLGGAGRDPKVSVCEQPVAWQEFLSFEDKYLRGSKQGGSEGKGGSGMASLDRQIPAPISETLTKQVQENALAAFKAIDASGVARVDSFVNESTGETWLMEINTTPGSFSFYLWEPSGLAFGALLDELIEIAMSEHRAKQELMFTFDSTLLDKDGGGKVGG